MVVYQSQTRRAALTIGLLSGLLILFTGAVGMIAAFHEREVVDDFISLGQLLLLATPFIAAYVVVRRLGAAGEATPVLLGCGIAIGLLTALPTIILLLFNSDEFRFLLDYGLRLVPFVVATYVAWQMHRSGSETYLVFGRLDTRSRFWSGSSPVPWL